MKKHNLIGQTKILSEARTIIDIFNVSNAEIRPHFILSGPSGAGKTSLVKILAEESNLGYFEINAAQLTKEGTSGNSLSKALSPLIQYGNKKAICFVDEFDKLFISGNSNDSVAHESTTGVQNEFLKVLESDTAAVFGDYGKYINVSCGNILFIFAGAFNGEENLTLDRLREMGIKTEFIGRVGLLFNLTPLTLEHLYSILENSKLLESYLALFEGITKEKAVADIKVALAANFDMNTLGARLITLLINQYFIKGGFDEETAKQVAFQSKLTFKTNK